MNKGGDMLKSLKTQIVFISFLCLVVGVMVITSTNYLVARHRAYQGLTEQNLALLKSHAEGISEWVNSKRSLVNASVNDAEPTRSLLTLRDTGLFVGTYFDYVSNSASPGLPSTTDQTSRPGYEQVLQTGKAIVTSPYFLGTSGKLFITFAAPAGSGTTITSLGAAQASMDAVVANVASIRPTANSLAFLVDSNGTIIAHPSEHMLLKPVNEVSAELTQEALGKEAAQASLMPVHVEGQKYLLMVVPVEGTSWQLVLVLNQAEALEPITAMLATSVAVSALVLLAVSVLLGGFISHRLARLAQLRDAMREVGTVDGDLSLRIDTRGDDELAEIATSFNTFADKQTFVLARIRESSTSVRFAAEEIAAGNIDLSHRTELTVSGLEGISASMLQLTDTVRINADSMLQANLLVTQASHLADQGGNVVGQAVQTMDQISSASRKIADIIGVIDGIAFQTNILALNAAVEAARAGEQGRGFAVVATEVRHLAQRSAHAAKEIKDLISASVECVQGGVQLVHSAGTTIQEIVSSVQQVVRVIGEVQSSTAKQSASIIEMGQAVLHLEELVQQNAALVEQGSASAASLKEQSVALSGVMGGLALKWSPTSIPL
ncbi:MAG: methyl-accepting chemotaxis protein [Burkholderiaceae bacterium]|nr:methyl-accepting chemotaxis protein [Burkholderiaceae bacterium]